MNDRQFREHLAELLNWQRNSEQAAKRNPPTPGPPRSTPQNRTTRKEAAEIRTLEAISRLGKEFGRRDLENASRGTEEAACQCYENVYHSLEIEMKHEG